MFDAASGEMSWDPGHDPPAVSGGAAVAAEATLDLEGELSRRFGLPSFRSWQREVVEEVLQGSGRCLVIAPTGGGKSLCYQFPASLLPGTTIVISPLIALMEDQVRSLNDRGIPATYLASNVDAEERIFPLALDRGIGVLVYLPFGRDRLWDRVEGHAVPEWAAEFGAMTWAQFFLKFAASHPAVTAVTPATSKPHHMVDNMTAARGRLPDQAERKRMVDFIAALPG